MLPITLGILLALVILFLLDRLGLWMERRGWIYWRKRRSKGTLGSTLLSLQDIFESGKASHILEIKQDDSKATPDPGGDEPAPPDAGPSPETGGKAGRPHGRPGAASRR